VIPSPAFPQNKVHRALYMMRSTVPEAAGSWVDRAVEAGVDALSQMPAETIIYGRAMPGASNVVAWHLARRTGRPWVAHFSDEWPAYGPLSNGKAWLAPYKWPLYQFWRRRIFADAGALTFTNPLQAADILRAHRRHLQKSFVVTHLSSSSVARNPPVAYDVFHIVHAGNVYYGRSSAALLAGLRLFLDRTPRARGRVLFTQAGWDAGDVPKWTQRNRLEHVVRVAGRLQEADLVALIESATLLVTIDFALPQSTTMPSKIPDYCDAKRPLLAITAPSTAIGRLFSDDGAGLTADFRSPEQVASCLARAFEAWEERRLDTLLPRETAVASFTRERVLAELASAFNMAQQRHLARIEAASQPMAAREQVAR
jgi:hypothetical protein